MKVFFISILLAVICAMLIAGEEFSRCYQHARRMARDVAYMHQQGEARQLIVFLESIERIL